MIDTLENNDILITSNTSTAPHEILTKIITDVLAIQSSLIATRETANSKEGFLISLFNAEELMSIIQKGGRLIIAEYKTSETGKQTVGYLLMTPIAEFTDLLSNKSEHSAHGRFTPSFEFDFANHEYLYQIGVSKEMKGHRVGRRLLEYVLKNATSGILTDILVEPVSNDISLQFFYKHDFLDAGLLELGEYRSFGQLKSKVLIWSK